jgi:hypothetical protein
MGSVVSEKEKHVCVYKEQYPCASQQVLPTISPTYWVNPPISQHGVGDILSEKINGRMNWLMGAKLEAHEDVLFIWILQLNKKDE